MLKRSVCINCLREFSPEQFREPELAKWVHLTFGTMWQLGECICLHGTISNEGDPPALCEFIKEHNAPEKPVEHEG